VTAGGPKSRDNATEVVSAEAMTKRKPGASVGRPKTIGEAPKVVSARLDDEEYRALRTIAFLRGTTASQILRDLVKAFLDKNPAPRLPKA
jgi:hypothetical protein